MPSRSLDPVNGIYKQAVEINFCGDGNLLAIIPAMCYIFNEQYSNETASGDAMRRFERRWMHEMKIGIIGAGKVGCSIGKYLADRGKTVTGYYSHTYESAAKAAEFASTGCFRSMEELAALSDTLFITTTDSQIGAVWDRMKAMPIDGRIICHFSGSLSSDVFVGIDEKKAYGASLHPMLAFRDKFSSYKQLNSCFFTLEGNSYALQQLEQLLEELNNPYRVIKAQEKAKYHCAASILSNDVLALLDLGFHLLSQCGFDKGEALNAAAALIRGNVENVLTNGTKESMTGPIVRGDVSTVEAHLEVLTGEEKEIYCLLGKRLLEMAQKKEEGQMTGEKLLKDSFSRIRVILNEGSRKSAVAEKIMD